jgi:hypothetical protein
MRPEKFANMHDDLDCGDLDCGELRCNHIAAWWVRVCDLPVESSACRKNIPIPFRGKSLP